MISAINSLSISQKPSSKKREGGPIISDERAAPVVSARKIIKHEAPRIDRSKILAKIQQREQAKQAKNKQKLAKSSHPDNKAMKIVPPKSKLLSKDPEQTREQLKSVLTDGGFQFSEKERKVLSQILNKDE